MLRNKKNIRTFQLKKCLIWSYGSGLLRIAEIFLQMTVFYKRKVVIAELTFPDGTMMLALVAVMSLAMVVARVMETISEMKLLVMRPVEM